MQKLITLSFLLFGVSLCVTAQEITRHIAVTGSAEIIVPPDELELEITLTQQHSKGNHSTFEELESKFFQTLARHGIAKDEVYFGNPQYYWYYWWSHRRYHRGQKSYRLRLDADTDFMALMQDLDFEGVQTVRITDSSNEEIQKLRKEVKIAAVKAAKDKASYMLEAVDEKLGNLLTMTEVEDNGWRWRNQNVISNVSMESRGGDSDIAQVAEIKLRYEVKAQFAIAE